MNSMSFLLDVGLKSFAVLATVGIAAALLRWASAATRHLVWFFGLTGLLALPILCVALPGWSVLPAWSHSLPSAKEQVPTTAALVPGVGASLALPIPTLGRARPTTAHSPLSLAPTAWVWMAWLGGALSALGPLAFAWVSLRKLERHAIVVTDHAWLDLLDRCKVRLSLHRRVVLLKSVDRQMPMAWGIARPRVLLPENAEAWTEQRRELTLLHELAHVKRHDSIVNYIAQAVCAVYWFNPLVWQGGAALAVGTGTSVR